MPGFEQTEGFIHYRVRDPDKKKYARFRTKDFGKGVQARIGFKRGGGSEVQSLLFDKKKFNSKEARAWVAKNKAQLAEEYVAQRSDVSEADRKRAVSKYGDVAYADPKNKKYPVNTPGHIRAAWNYINKKKNAAKYSASDVRKIKARIIAAWKSKINKAGPPSASQMSEQLEEFAMQKVKDFTMFRAGDYPQGQFDDAKLDEIAASYDPVSLHEAPVYIGHSSDYGDSRVPAFGWIGSIKRVGETLVAEGAELAEEAIQWVKDGYYKKVSAAFYKPDDPSNPTPGKYYLHHVALLGAQPPQVKGLPALGFAEFSEETDFVTIEMNDASPEEIQVVQHEAGEDTAASIQEETDAFLEDIQAILDDDSLDEDEKSQAMQQRRWQMESCLSQILSDHQVFMRKTGQMLDRVVDAQEGNDEMKERAGILAGIKQAMVDMMEKLRRLDPRREVKSKLTELHNNQRKESIDMDAKEKQELEGKITALQTQVTSFQELLKTEREAREKIELASVKDKAEAADDKIRATIHEFTESKVREGYSRSKIDELHVEDMLFNLAKANQKVKFADGKEKGLDEIFREFFSGLPKAVFTEIAGKEKEAEGKGISVPSSMVTAGYPIDGKKLQTVAFAEKYVNDHAELYKTMTPEAARRNVLMKIMNKEIIQN